MCRMTISTVQNSYRELQTAASVKVSAAVTESSRLFQTVMDHKPTEAARLPSSVRDSFDPRSILSKHADVSARLIRPQSVDPVRRVVSTQSRQHLNLTPAVPLLGDGQNGDSTFIALIAELMKPFEKSYQCTSPTPLSRTSPSLSSVSHRRSATPASVRARTPSMGPRGFGSSVARFTDEVKPPTRPRSANTSANSSFSKLDRSGISSVASIIAASRPLDHVPMRQVEVHTLNRKFVHRDSLNSVTAFGG